MQEREKQTLNTDINRRKVDVRITEYTNQLLTSIQEYFTVVNVQFVKTLLQNNCVWWQPQVRFL